VVDDHRIVRKGLIELLNSTWDICGEAEDGTEAVEKVLELHPDLVIMDLVMPHITGTAATRAIRKLRPKTKIVFLSMHSSETVGELSMLAGADAYLTKGCSTELLKRTIAKLLDPLLADAATA